MSESERRSDDPASIDEAFDANSSETTGTTAEERQKLKAIAEFLHKFSVRFRLDGFDVAKSQVQEIMDGLVLDRFFRIMEEEK